MRRTEPRPGLSTGMWTHIGQPRPASKPAGRSHTAARAATDAKNQFETNDNAVRPKFAIRRGCVHGFARNIGTAISIRAAAAMAARMTLIFVSGSPSASAGLKMREGAAHRGAARERGPPL